MRKLQKFRITLQTGKEVKKDVQGDIRRVMDSSAENLLIESEITYSREKEISQEKKAIRIFDIWEDKGESARDVKKEAKTPKNKIKQELKTEETK